MPSSVHNQINGCWVTQHGETIKIEELDLSHLLNIVALLYRKGGEDNPQRPKLVTLEKEIMKRFKDLHSAIC